MTALALADVRWRSRRDPAGGPPAVHVSFLTSVTDRRTSAAVAGIVGYLDSLAGRPRREFDPDVPVTIAGERRLARGLTTVCFGWYRWTARGFAEALPASVAEVLARAGITTPSELRLRLFDLVNQYDGGFVPSTRRHGVLERLANGLGLPARDASTLDTAMTLDAEEEAVLVRPDTPPSVTDVVAAYNRALLAAMLRQSERIVFTLHDPGGALVRRLYALCRHLGVYCDVEAAGGGGGFRLTLAGPDAVVGPPAAAGPRLMVAALRVIGAMGPEDRGAAHLVLRDRPYRLVLDQDLLRLPGLHPNAERGTRNAEWGAGIAEKAAAYRAVEDAAPVSPTPDPQLPSPSFDSEVEARLAREFAALDRQGRAAGWQLVREPAPLLAGGRVLIPDFGLERDGQRVFVEVIGFWTPGYLARKRQALERLAAGVPLVLAVAEPSAAVFAGLPFPIVVYKGAVRVHELLRVAEAHHGGFAARTEHAEARLAAVCSGAEGTGWIAERALAAALACHSPGEVARVLAVAAIPVGWEYVPGAGLLGTVLRTALGTVMEAAWARGVAHLTPAEVRALIADGLLPEQDDALVAIVERLPSCTVARGSLFDVTVRPPGAVLPPSLEPPSPPVDTGAPARPSAPRRGRPASASAPMLL